VRDGKGYRPDILSRETEGRRGGDDVTSAEGGGARRQVWYGDDKQRQRAVRVEEREREKREGLKRSTMKPFESIILPFRSPANHGAAPGSC
jgi:hypothetical protein